MLRVLMFCLPYIFKCTSHWYSVTLLCWYAIKPVKSNSNQSYQFKNTCRQKPCKLFKPELYIFQCPDSASKKDLLAYLQRIALYCHQLNITSKVKADVQSVGGELIVSGVSKTTVKHVLVLTCIKQSPAFKARYFEIPDVCFNGKLTCIEYPPDFIGHWFALSHTGCLRQVCLLLRVGFLYTTYENRKYIVLYMTATCCMSADEILSGHQYRISLCS